MGLEAQDLRFGFGERAVLRGITARFPPASVTAVLGPNGAGKTTLLRLLLGVLKPEQGAVLKDARGLWDLTRHERAASMAYIPQTSQVAFPFTVSEVVRLGRFAAGRGNDQESVASAMARMDIADRALDAFGELSAGQQQRVTVARALAQLDARNVKGATGAGTRVLLADEPVSAMDPSHALRTLGLFRSLAAEGLCVVVVLHDLGLVLRYVERVLVLSADGMVAGEGETAGTLTPDLLSRVYGLRYRALMDPAAPGRAAAMIPVGDV